MNVALYRTPSPLHLLFLAGSVPLFLGALLSDIAYFTSYQPQWSNFASWLIAGAQVFAGLALLCALIDRFATHRLVGGTRLYILWLLLAWVIGLVNAFTHARDAWAVMPWGLALSVLTVLLSAMAAWTGLTRLYGGAVQ
jgi:uncharacterized membrane protein